MVKKAYLVFFLLISFSGLKAQQIQAASNPFSNLEFLNGPTDTLTLTASYAGEYGNIGENDRSTLMSIAKIYKLDVKKFEYAVSFKLAGYPQTFYAPFKDNNMPEVISAKKNGISTLRLKCVVYHFYYIDGICNFFYINKVSVVNKAI